MPPRFTPRTLAHWPWVVVRVDCVLCRRRGCYRLARLAAKYGPEQSIDGLLRDLAHNCPWYNERPRKYEPRCGARFTDLEHAFPPADHPDESLHRQRQPDRESLPKRRLAERFPATYEGGAPMLSTWPHAEIALSCTLCGKAGVFDVVALRAKLHGEDMAMTFVRNHLADGCPLQRARSSQACGAVLRMPGP